ncbi:hypothetical protein [Ligilactobacillus apodemi]|uniref:Uncharacterized protein n=1 Tax=Ligilactobacillus apodemi DSM 16634 = JCM 16172 TaxID=1423724 RepID=A0A0R1TVA9_9LACO|nr:hypothetical protein [Ligilactobacillus apodemi]KRL84734.1 hypothetical protein FC32_GL000213 [Ligilactobacillus apodemi DSM 16634 = JCM 16172]MCR1901170.1 hypothetical protein [Ligilactobacillus apodemi]
MFTTEELGKIEQVLASSPSLNEYEVKQALRALNRNGTCNVRDLGYIEYKLAYLPFAHAIPRYNGNLNISRW